MDESIVKKSRREKRKAKEKLEKDKANLLHEYGLVNHIFANALSCLIPLGKAMVIEFNKEFYLVLKRTDQIETHKISRGDYGFYNDKGEPVELFNGMLVRIDEKDKKLNDESKVIH